MRFISPRTHTIIGSIVGLALLFAPNIFGFSDVGGAAVALPRFIGIVVLISELSARGSFSRIGFIPMGLHLTMDVILGLFLAMSPWLFDFSNVGSNAWVPHFVVGLLIASYALMTHTSEQDVGSSKRMAA